MDRPSRPRSQPDLPRHLLRTNKAANYTLKLFDFATVD